MPPANKLRVTLFRAGSHEGPKALILPATWDEFIKVACQKLHINGIARVETLEGAHVELLDEILPGDKLRVIPSDSPLNNNARQKTLGKAGGAMAQYNEARNNDIKKGPKGMKNGKKKGENGETSTGDEDEENDDGEEQDGLDDQEDGTEGSVSQRLSPLSADDNTSPTNGSGGNNNQKLVGSAAAFQPNGFDHHDSLTEHHLKNKAHELLSMIGEEDFFHSDLLEKLGDENSFQSNGSSSLASDAVTSVNVSSLSLHKITSAKKPSGEGAARFSPIIRILRDNLVATNSKEMERRILACNLQSTMPDWQMRLGVSSIFDYLQEAVDVGLINVRAAGSVSYISLSGDQHCGVVKWVKESYGFIQSPAHTEDLFYHVSEVRVNRALQTGDIVDFLVVRNPITGKLNATQISLLQASEDDAGLAALNALSAAVMRQTRHEDVVDMPQVMDGSGPYGMYQQMMRAEEGQDYEEGPDGVPSVNHEPWLYKTKMCKFWPHCPRGPKCWFAHGVNDLRKPSQIPAHMLDPSFAALSVNGGGNGTQSGSGVGPNAVSAGPSNVSGNGNGNMVGGNKNFMMMDNSMNQGAPSNPAAAANAGSQGFNMGMNQGMANYLGKQTDPFGTAFALSDSQLGWASTDDWNHAANNVSRSLPSDYETGEFRGLGKKFGQDRW